MFNIYLINTDTFKAEKLIAKEVSLREASHLEQTEQKKYNSINYYVAGFEVGEPADLKAREDLKND